MAGQRGKNLGMGDVLEVGVMLADEWVAERGGDEDAGWEGRILADGEAIAESERVGVESLEKVGFCVLSVFPVQEGGREVWVKSVAEEFEQRGGAIQDEEVDF